MKLPEEILAAGARLAEAERQVQLQRAEYHTLIRRLHLAGAPLREIAQALGISHQRVQQIVEAAGGSWWQRIWRTRNSQRDAVCTFCGRPPSEVARLIAGPDVYICDACIALAEQVLSGRGPQENARLRAARSGATARCSFCNKRWALKRTLARAAEANICGECLAVCRQILDHLGAHPP